MLYTLIWFIMDDFLNLGLENKVAIVAGGGSYHLVRVLVTEDLLQFF